MVGVSANDDSGEGCGKAHPGQTILRQHYLFVLWLGARALGCVLRCREVPLLSSLVDIREGCCLFAPPWGVLSLPTRTEVDPCLFTRGVKLLRWGALPLRSAQAGMSTGDTPSFLFSTLGPPWGVLSLGRPAMPTVFLTNQISCPVGKIATKFI